MSTSHSGFYEETDITNLCHLEKAKDGTACLALVLLVGSWNRDCDYRQGRFLEEIFRQLTHGLDCRVVTTCVKVEESIFHIIIGDDNDSTKRDYNLPLPPEELPAIALVGQTTTMKHSKWIYVDNLRPSHIRDARRENEIARRIIRKEIANTLAAMADQMNISVHPEACRDAIRIFIAGDKSSVGKTSICLAIIAGLLHKGYSTDELAYIKPATQSESAQLIQLFCQQHDIQCVPVGPIVYYRGFTRAFLARETESTEQLLQRASNAADRVAIGKKIVLIDGVGFPAVGSICGTDNAMVAKHCGYPISSHHRTPPGVLLVGASGVGAAVDAYNLNATYFESRGVPVMGAIFNKLALDGFYSLENCRTQVTSYFEQYQPDKQPFGFVPSFPSIAGRDAIQNVQTFVDIFRIHVNVNRIVETATRIKNETPIDEVIPLPSSIDDSAWKRRKVAPSVVRTRDEIENHAIGAGAAPSA